jgi:uncharacterized protein YkwD
VATAGSFSHSRAPIACVFAALAALLLVIPASAQAGSASMDRVERSIVRKLNKIRASNGLPRFRTNRALARGADFHCNDMLRANFFAHNSSNGQGMGERVESFRHSNWVGETLAYVPTSGARGQAARIVQMWMDSPPHRASLLDPKFTRIGVGRRRGTLNGQGSIVFTADLASRR